jgi:CelD/BcsL family acetyltransferase involved in cellulose biosynthesis
LRWTSFKKWERARHSISDRDELKNNLSRDVKKSLRRRMRRLAELGEVGFDVRCGAEVTPAVVDRFLALENTGWKKAQGTSLHSVEKDAQFFREMVDNFSRAGRIVFNELSLNATVIAASVIIVSGKGGFGFKLGWNPEYAKLSIGNLLQHRILESTHAVYAALEFIDSGADEDADYMNVMLNMRQKMESGVYALTRAGKNVAPLVGLSARLVKGFRNRTKV